MLEKPDLQDEVIVSCLQSGYGLDIQAIAFLPIGADLNTAVYRAVAVDEKGYFVKLRSGDFIEASVTVPDFLSSLGVRQVIPALKTQSGQLWADMPPYKLILYPFVPGRHGYEQKLAPECWADFGRALRQLHTAPVPAALTHKVPRELFSSEWRDSLKMFLKRFETETFQEPAAHELASFLKTKKEDLFKLLDRAEHCAQILQKQPPEFILCHGDIHGWNLLVDAAGALFMVDWDTLIFAPRERDLMFIGAGLGDSGYTPQEEENLFYQGYGKTELNPAALVYYRCERIIEDIAAICGQIFLSEAGGEDRKQALIYAKSNFLPGSTIERAWQADQTLIRKE